jgi:hypothetical protein
MVEVIVKPPVHTHDWTKDTNDKTLKHESTQAELGQMPVADDK